MDGDSDSDSGYSTCSSNGYHALMEDLEMSSESEPDSGDSGTYGTV